MLCWFFSGDFWLSGVMGVQSTAHYHIYIYIYTWTDLFWHILSQNWNTNLPGILMFNGKTKVFLSFFPSTDPLILKMGTLRSHFWICRFNDEGYYQYSSSNLLVLGREWMGCWGLLGWLLLVIMDHSRKFPAFSTSKPKRVNTCENYYWCCLKIGKPASPESIGYSSSILLKLGSRWQPSPFGTTLWTRPAALCATVPWPSCWKVRWTVGVMEDISIGL